MGSRRSLVITAVICLAAVAAGTALAGQSKTSANVTTIKAVTSVPKMKVNRYIQDGLRWDKDVYTVKSGGTLHIVNDAADEGPHTFTVVQQSDEPKTGLQAVQCPICGKLAKAHGADPNSDAPPKFQYLENGVGQKTPPKIDRPGDSGVTGPGKKGESIDLTVTAPKGTKLYFMCLIHPWMQAEVDVT
jgi:uncharacterized cupredoxin-like copper-binding protein